MAPTTTQLLSESLFGFAPPLPPSTTVQNNSDQENVNHTLGALAPPPPQQTANPTTRQVLPLLQPGEVPGPDRLYGRTLNAEFLQLCIHLLHATFYSTIFWLFLRVFEHKESAERENMKMFTGGVLLLSLFWHGGIVVLRFFQSVAVYRHYPKHSARIAANNRYGVNHLVPFTTGKNRCLLLIAAIIAIVEAVWLLFAVLTILATFFLGMVLFVFQLVITANACAVFQKALATTQYADPDSPTQQAQPTQQYQPEQHYTPQYPPPQNGYGSAAGPSPYAQPQPTQQPPPQPTAQYGGYAAPALQQPYNNTTLGNTTDTPYEPLV